MKKDDITDVLFLPYRKELLVLPTKVLFLVARLSDIYKGMDVTLVQVRQDLAAPLTLAGYKVSQVIPAGPLEAVWILPNKDQQETRFLLAEAVAAVGTGGTIMAAAANDAGGKRLPDLFEELGLTPASESKHKARVVYATVTGFNRDTADLWRREGQEQPILDGSIISRPGLHGWNKIDDGSALLARHLPELHGHIADFGCGWGYLSLQAAGHAKRLTLIDVDARAIDLAERNVKKKFPSLGISTIWADLTRPEKLGPFDAILLNPPFHDGTKAAPEIGQAIIRTAARSLAPAGSLYLVANKHLPYENTLRDAFKHVELLAEENGFKTLVCR